MPDINTEDRCHAPKHGYLNGDDNTEIMMVEVAGGGHPAPGIKEKTHANPSGRIGNQNADTEGADEVWAFFKD